MSAWPNYEISYKVGVQRDEAEDRKQPDRRHAAVAATSAVGAPGLASAQTVNIYNWNDYIGETTLEDFKAETGISYNYDIYDNLEILEQKLLVGRSGYDITVPTAEPTMSRLIKAGALQKLDKSKIPNLKNLDPALMKQVERSDPGNQYGVIYQWGTIGIGINAEKIKALMPDAPLDSFKLIFDPEVAKKLAPCGITILDSATDTFPTVLHYLGLDPNSDKAGRPEEGRGSADEDPPLREELRHGAEHQQPRRR